MHLAYHHRLINEFNRRKAINSRYSLRQFAKHLGLSPSILSLVLKGERHLQKKNILQVGKALKWSSEEIEKIIQEATDWQTKNRSLKIHNRIEPLPNQYHFLLERNYMWCYTLAKVKSNQANPKWIAEQMGISTQQADVLLERLIKEGFLEIKNGEMQQTQKKIIFVQHPPSQEMLQYRTEIHQLGLSAISGIDDQEQLSLVKHVILDQKSLKRLGHMIYASSERWSKAITKKDSKDVYYLTVQVFPAKADRK